MGRRRARRAGASAAAACPRGRGRGDRTLDIDLAILDVNLRGAQSFPVAEVLAARGVPFLFATGYDATILKPPYSGTPTLQKPFQLEDLRQLLALATFKAGG